MNIRPADGPIAIELPAGWDGSSAIMTSVR